MPGIKLEQVGSPQQTHGFARVGWRAAGPDGKAMYGGTNFYRLSPRGKIAAVVGFWDGM